MKYVKGILIICICLVVALDELSGTSDDFNSYFIEAARRAKPSVVNILIYKKNIKNHSLKKVAYASGTILFNDGVIVTNYHVVKKGNYFQVTNETGDIFELQEFDGGMFYISDKKTDIAIMKVKNPQNLPLVPITLSDSNNLSQGEWVIAIGNPYGLAQSITGGIVSSTGRDNIGFTDIEDFIQSDVPINPGNSGGPLINLRGEMVGLNTAISTVSGGYQGISFAIPVNIVQQVCSELRQYGHVRRGWLGFMAREQKDNNRNIRIMVESVLKGSPAESAGIRQGDQVLEIDKKKIASLGSLIKAVSNKTVGSRIHITVLRNGTIKQFNVLLREKNQYRRIKKELTTLYDRYGIEIDENAEKNDVIVSFVSPRSLMYDIKKGDIIISVNNIKVFSLDDFIKAFYKNSRRIKTITVYRDSQIYTIDFNQ